jgi:hypothetical protein
MTRLQTQGHQTRLCFVNVKPAAAMAAFCVAVRRDVGVLSQRRATARANIRGMSTRRLFGCAGRRILQLVDGARNTVAACKCLERTNGYRRADCHERQRDQARKDLEKHWWIVKTAAAAPHEKQHRQPDAKKRDAGHDAHDRAADGCLFDLLSRILHSTQKIVCTNDAIFPYSIRLCDQIIGADGRVGKELPFCPSLLVCPPIAEIPNQLRHFLRIERSLNSCRHQRKTGGLQRFNLTASQRR